MCPSSVDNLKLDIHATPTAKVTCDECGHKWTTTLEFQGEVDLGLNHDADSYFDYTNCPKCKHEYYYSISIHFNGGPA